MSLDRTQLVSIAIFAICSTSCATSEAGNTPTAILEKEGARAYVRHYVLHSYYQWGLEDCGLDDQSLNLKIQKESFPDFSSLSEAVKTDFARKFKPGSSTRRFIEFMEMRGAPCFVDSSRVTSKAEELKATPLRVRFSCVVTLELSKSDLCDGQHEMAQLNGPKHVVTHWHFTPMSSVRGQYEIFDYVTLKILPNW